MTAQASMMEFHKLCEIFPEMPREEYEALRADIEANGQRVAIWTWRGVILEGRARYRACRELGIEPKLKEWDGEDGPDLVAFIMSLNYHRRHLNQSQKGLIATIAEEKFAEQAKRRAKERARERADARKKGEPRKDHEFSARDYKDSSAGKAAELVGVSPDTVYKAKRIQREAPELAEQVKRGEMTLHQADREVKRIEKRRDLETRAALHVVRDSDPFRIVAGDSSEFLYSLNYPACAYPWKPGEFRLVFADPPYNQGVEYGDHYDDDRDDDDYAGAMGRLAVGVSQALAPDGAFLLLVSHEWAWRLVGIVRDAGFHLNQWITWYETFGVNCPRKFNRCSRALLWFVKDPNRFVFNPEAVNRPSDRQVIYKDRRADPGGKTWDDVWGINPPIPRLVGTAKERIPDFPTQLPLALLRPVVGAFSDPGDLVLDPFSGSGTTGAACLELGRRFVGVELSPAFAELSRKRLLVHSKEHCHATQDGVAHARLQDGPPGVRGVGGQGIPREVPGPAR